MIIAVASGKGGTGKTTVATNLALSLKDGVQFLDCDVEEPNAHIFLKPQIEERMPVGIPVPQIDETKCNYCGKCAEVCEYNALVVIKTGKRILIFPELCHGCGGCTLLCPEGAISEVDREIGIVEKGQVGSSIRFVHGKLAVGEAMPTPVVRAVKQNINRDKIVIIDVSPGTACPVIEAIKGSDFCTLVTEPTPFGLNDLRLAVETLRELKVPMGVVINRANIGDSKVNEYCQKEKIPILLRIPMDKNLAVAYSKGIPVVITEEESQRWRKMFISLYEYIKQILSSNYTKN